jgi:hypothetical protein
MHVLKLFKQLHFPLLRKLLENKISFHQNLVPYAQKSLLAVFPSTVTVDSELAV